MQQTVRLRIHGKVQGVFFRASAKKEAQALDLTGWVKNTPEGDVECLCTGEEENINSFISWCWKGPSQAVVTDVKSTAELLQQFFDFVILKERY